MAKISFKFGAGHSSRWADTPKLEECNRLGILVSVQPGKPGKASKRGDARRRSQPYSIFSKTSQKRTWDK
jgi:hypothetical protein